MNDIKMAQLAVTVCSEHSIESQASTPVASQAATPIASPAGDEYIPLPPNIPQSNDVPKEDNFKHLEHVARPEVVRKFANPAPLGLCAFALTSFVSNAMNLYMANGTVTGINIGLALIYGGISQFLAGMWYVGSLPKSGCCVSVTWEHVITPTREMALGNTFGATTFCSFGAYWITFATLSEIDTTNPVVVKTAESCQTEILMGIFMMVRYDPWTRFYLRSASGTSMLIIRTRHGSSSQLSCYYALSSPASPCF